MQLVQKGYFLLISSPVASISEVYNQQLFSCVLKWMVYCLGKKTNIW